MRCVSAAPVPLILLSVPNLFVFIQISTERSYGSASAKFRKIGPDGQALSNPWGKGIEEFMLYQSIVHEAKHFSSGMTKLPLPETVAGKCLFTPL